MMKAEVANRLLQLNRQFYADFASSFAETRQAPQPGFLQLNDYLPKVVGRVVDVGCGNGRFGLYLYGRLTEFEYTGIDFTPELLRLAQRSVGGDFILRDISQPGFMAGLTDFDLGVCLATLQHIPGGTNRTRLLAELAGHIRKGGRIFLSNWQFAHSARQRRKIVDWEQAGLSAHDLEENDYLLTWQRNGRGLRYVHIVDSTEIAKMAGEASLSVVDEFRSDGREGDLNLYTVLSRTS